MEEKKYSTGVDPRGRDGRNATLVHGRKWQTNPPGMSQIRVFATRKTGILATGVTRSRACYMFLESAETAKSRQVIKKKLA